jgi:hypothetical protein
MKPITLLLVMLAAAPVAGHHSHAMFDGSTESEIAGVLTAVRFVNPHVYLRIDATHRDGKPLQPTQTWAIEMSTTQNMTQRGITPAILKVGAPISVKVNPLFSGGLSGNYTNLVMLDGVRNTTADQNWKPAIRN